MFEYQINVAEEGKHLFRTDWIGDRVQANRAFSRLRDYFYDSMFSVTCVRRSRVMEQVDRELNVAR